MHAFIILNGKKAGRDDIRQAITTLRKQGYSLDVRVTWEHGDVARFVAEAYAAKADRILIGGGDGSINEITQSLMGYESTDRIPLGLIPLGTANDFATSCGIPQSIDEAFKFALTQPVTRIDVLSVNEQCCINMITAGFGAKVTAETPEDLKNFLGGGAYVLAGVLQSFNFIPYNGILRCDGEEETVDVIVAAIGNGRQAGGGQVLCPNAYLNDGLMDILIIQPFPLTDITQVISELTDDSNGQYVFKRQAKYLEASSKIEIPVNLDGEPFQQNQLNISVCPKALPVIIPNDSGLLQ